MKHLKSMLVLVLFAAFSVSVIGKNIDSPKSPYKLQQGEQIVDLKMVVDAEGKLVNVLHEDGIPANIKDPNPDEVTWTGQATIAMKQGHRDGDPKSGCFYMNGNCYCW